MSAATKYAPHYSVEDYRLWKGDWELWNGIAIAMAPSPFGAHQAVVVALAAELRAAIRAIDCQATTLVELDWIVSSDTVVRPDVLVVGGKPPQRHLEQRPELLAEVLSPATRKNDLTYKRELYADQGVPIYLIVDPVAKTVEKLTSPSAGTYHSSSISSVLELTLCRDCELKVDCSNLFSHDVM